MREQLEQMDDWDRAFYREWTSLITRNALAFPYPMGDPVGRESEAQTLMATPIRGYVEGSAASTGTSVAMEGTLEDGTTTSGSTQTTIVSRIMEFQHPSKGDGVAKKQGNRKNPYGSNR